MQNRLDRLPLILDVETTAGPTKGNPFSKGNQCYYVGYKQLHSTFQYHHSPDGSFHDMDVRRIQQAIDSCSFLTGFNIRFDLHWLRKIGVDISRVRVWCCQYGEFLLENQTNPYPSLEQSAVKYNLGHKIDVIATEYWAKGIDTSEVPVEEMLLYLEQDVLLTESVFQIQMEAFKTSERSKYRLFQLCMEDLLVLEEIEWNGILYDAATSLTLADGIAGQIQTIDEELQKGYEGVPINWDSGQQLSAYLYGGNIDVETRLPIGVYKTGAKVGHPRYKVVVHTYSLPRQVEPLKGTELLKEGTWQTNEDTLKQLRGSKESKRRISLLQQRVKLEKLRGTYYQGLPEKLVEMAWSDNYLHPNFNQCTAITGRLSSSNPNGQNMPPDAKQLCVSRFNG